MDRPGQYMSLRFAKPAAPRQPHNSAFEHGMAVSATQREGRGVVSGRQAGQTLEGSFSAVSTPMFASK